MFNLAIKLRGCDLVALRAGDVSARGKPVDPSGSS
jgi:hypothetical protein